ncbi:hypothetical protein PARPLA_03249 [Rhodobacteraceae bacterium THAF1]|uniref:nuclear transport factor 2 family protein n=1 Tax=Palleronia sp. THAF1 TaxID=2587842 RepID=UPI000F3B85CA|nr:nuclear transport factor 2 family protein [Palleronia sp. THAF1]QFU08777.1 hypothetical protein FIU81_08840 [Palleronia sp. THAF1]VDC31210.1 hypothetical protein PARPLA_03249 [Rhodobacteraceae bacterium THAF1]
MSPALSLVRSWVQGYFNGHDPSVARQICARGYTLSIGDVAFSGRDNAWLPAVDVQMRDYPGLSMTVHEALTGDDWTALWFSEHGERDGTSAAWSGVSIYRRTGDVLTRCIAQEDYFTRRRQLKSGKPDRIDRAAVAPWDVTPGAADPEAEAVVAQWLEGGWPRPDVRCDDEHLTGERVTFEVDVTDVLEMRSVGETVAFAVRQSGTFLGGLPGAVPGPDFIDVNGIVHVRGGRVVSGRVIRDRMGLRARRRRL